MANKKIEPRFELDDEILDPPELESEGQLSLDSPQGTYEQPHPSYEDKPISIWLPLSVCLVGFIVTLWQKLGYDLSNIQLIFSIESENLGAVFVEIFVIPAMQISFIVIISYLIFLIIGIFGVGKSTSFRRWFITIFVAIYIVGILSPFIAGVQI